MEYLITNFWLPVTIAALLGLCVGWATCQKHSVVWRTSWLPFAIIAFAAGVFLAIQIVLEGRAGLWLEVGLMLFTAYLAGCCAGCMMRWLILREDHDTDGAFGYAIKVAWIGTGAPSEAGPSPAWEETTENRRALQRSYALTTSGADYTMTVAGINTLAAEDIARAAASTLPATSARASGPARTDYVLKVAGINTVSAQATQAPIATVMKAGVLAPHSDTQPPMMRAVVAAVSDARPLAAASPPAALADPASGVQPVLLSAPRGGKRDELSLIWGIADKLEERMNSLGIWHFDQIAEWTPHNVTWFEKAIEGFKGRVERDKWIEQCKKLRTGWRPDSDIGERPKF